MFHQLFFNSRVSYLLQVVPAAALAGAVYIAVCAARKLRWDGTRVAKCLFVCYLTALFGIVLVPANFWNHVWYPVFYGQPSGSSLEWFTFQYNLIPTFIRRLMGTYTSGSWVSFMAIANVLLLVPFGVLHPLANPEKKTLKTGFSTILAIELLQPIVGRSFDVDDLICNGLGLLIGYGVYRLVHNRINPT